jgi:hypothetical protein
LLGTTSQSRVRARNIIEFILLNTSGRGPKKKKKKNKQTNKTKTKIFTSPEEEQDVHIVGGEMADVLPSEVWEEIFGWLDTVQDLCACTATCRSWAALCWRERHHVSLRVRPKAARGEASSEAEERRQEEPSSASGRRPSPEDMAIELVARRCGKLQRLDVHGTELNVGPQAVSMLLVSCTRLTQLHLDRCSSSMFTDAITAAAAQHPSGAGSRLTALTLCGMRRLTDDKLAESFGKFSSLRSLSLESCTQLTSNGLVTLATLCPQLTALRLHVRASVGSDPRSLSGLADLGLNVCAGLLPCQGPGRDRRGQDVLAPGEAQSAGTGHHHGPHRARAGRAPPYLPAFAQHLGYQLATDRSRARACIASLER